MSLCSLVSCLAIRRRRRVEQTIACACACACACVYGTKLTLVVPCALTDWRPPRFAEDNDIVVISDEIYDGVTSGGRWQSFGLSVCLCVCVCVCVIVFGEVGRLMEKT